MEIPLQQLTYGRDKLPVLTGTLRRVRRMRFFVRVSFDNPPLLRKKTRRSLVWAVIDTGASFSSVPDKLAPGWIDQVSSSWNVIEYETLSTKGKRRKYPYTQGRVSFSITWRRGFGLTHKFKLRDVDVLCKKSPFGIRTPGGEMRADYVILGLDFLSGLRECGYDEQWRIECLPDSPKLVSIP